MFGDWRERDNAIADLPRRSSIMHEHQIFGSIILVSATAQPVPAYPLKRLFVRIEPPAAISIPTDSHPGVSVLTISLVSIFQLASNSRMSCMR